MSKISTDVVKPGNGYSGYESGTYGDSVGGAHFEITTYSNDAAYVGTTAVGSGTGIAVRLTPEDGRKIMEHLYRWLVEMEGE